MAQSATGIRSGVCKNLPSNCSKAGAKEIQRAAATRFLCEECGLELRPEAGKRGLPLPDWFLPAAGAVLAIVLVGFGARFMMAGSAPSCPAADLDEFLAGKPEPAKALEAAGACRDAIRTQADAALVAAVARLCRTASDGGSAEGMRCLAELYDPKEVRPGRLGQMPAPDADLSKDLYARAERLMRSSRGQAQASSPDADTAK